MVLGSGIESTGQPLRFRPFLARQSQARLRPLLTTAVNTVEFPFRY
jgi:hypothetical protein